MQTAQMRHRGLEPRQFFAHVRSPQRPVAHVLRTWCVHPLPSSNISGPLLHDPGERSPPQLAGQLTSPSVVQQAISSTASAAYNATQSHTVPTQWARVAADHGDRLALVDPHRKPPISLTFRQTERLIHEFAAGLRDLGLEQGERVSIFSENSSRWLVADQAILMNGAVDAVRGSSAPVEELMYILRHSGSSALVVQDAEALARLLPELAKPTAPHLKFVLLLWGTPDATPAAAAAAASSPPSAVAAPEASHNGASSFPLDGVRIRTFEEVLERGRGLASSYSMPHIVAADLATLVYTSGTTGRPKGVMLSHGNLQYQVDQMAHYVTVLAGQRTLSLLPPWHIYERVVSYHTLSRGVTQVYSSIRKFRDDLAVYPPDYLVCVPLVLETLKSRVLQRVQAMSAVRRAVVTFLLSVSVAFVTARRVVQGTALRYARSDTPRTLWAYLKAAFTVAFLRPLHLLANTLVFGKVREALGVRSAAICGGSSLPPPLDDFFEAIGLEVVNGWGLTEASPVLACRRALALENVRGSVGVPMPGTTVRVVNPESLEDVADGQHGLLLARGPGVMQGYYGDSAATDKAFRAGGGWLDTGDVGWRCPAGVPGSSMAGHVVLTGRSKDTVVLSNGKKVEPQVIEDAVQGSPLIKFCIVLGQDKRALGALLFSDEDAVAALGLTGGPEELQELLAAEVTKYNKARDGYRVWDFIAAVAVARTPLAVEDGTLTRTMKPRRPQILDIHSTQVEDVMRRLR